LGQPNGIKITAAKDDFRRRHQENGAKASLQGQVSLRSGGTTPRPDGGFSEETQRIICMETHISKNDNSTWFNPWAWASTEINASWNNQELKKRSAVRNSCCDKDNRGG